MNRKLFNDILVDIDFGISSLSLKLKKFKTELQ